MSSVLINIWESNQKRKVYKEIPKFPSVKRDLSIVVDLSVKPGEIEKVIRQNSGKNLKKVRLTDYFPIKDENKISYTFSLQFLSEEKTFTDEEINAIQNKIVKNLNKELKAELRS